MTKEDKELLFKDISGRIPYGLRVQSINIDRCLVLGITKRISFFNNSLHIDVITNICNYELASVKPYLRPMTSMTEEEKEEYNKVMFQSERYENDYAADIDWLNAHHFDYRGLIEKGLALEAPEGMYK